MQKLNGTRRDSEGQKGTMSDSEKHVVTLRNKRGSERQQITIADS